MSAEPTGRVICSVLFSVTGNNTFWRSMQEYIWRFHSYFDCSCFSGGKSCLTLCDPMDCSTPGFPVHHQRAQTHVYRVGWSHLTILSSVIPFYCLQSFPVLGSFPRSQFFTSGGQSIGVSALVSVHPMNIQDWFPSELTVLTSLHSKGLSRVFSNTTFQKHQLVGIQPSLWYNSYYWKKHSFDYTDFSSAK